MNNNKFFSLLKKHNQIIEFYDFLYNIEKDKKLNLKETFKLNIINIDNKTEEELKVYNIGNFELPEIIFDKEVDLKLDKNLKENNEFEYKNPDNF